MKNILSLLLRVLLLSISRLEYSAKNDYDDDDADDPNAPKKGFEYKNTDLFDIPGMKDDKFAALYNLPPPLPDDKNGASAPKPEDKDKPKADDKTKEPPESAEMEIVAPDLTKEKAIELLKDYADDDKVEVAGETFTKAEFLKKFDEKPAADDKDKDKDKPKTYTVGGKELGEAEYAELLTKATAHYGWDAEYVKSKREQDLVKDLETFQKKEEVDKGSKEVNERNQEIAKIRRVLDTEATKLQKRYGENEKLLDDLAKEKTAKEKAMVKLDEVINVKTDDIEDDDERKKAEKAALKAEFDKKFLEKDLEKIKKDEEAGTNKLQELTQKSANIFMYSALTDIQAKIPELRLPAPALTIVNDKTGAYSDYDIEKAGAALQLAEDYYTNFVQAPDADEKVEAFYKRKRFKYRVDTPPPAAPGKEKPKETPKDTGLKKRVLKLLDAQGRSPFSIPGPGEPGKGKLSADKQWDADRKKLGYDMQDWQNKNPDAR